MQVFINVRDFERLKEPEFITALVQNYYNIDSPMFKASAEMLACSLEPIKIYKPEASGFMQLKIHGTQNFSAEEKAKIDEAKRIFDIVVNSSLYHNKIKDSWHILTETKGYDYNSFMQLYLSGDCNFTGADNTMDLNLIMYYNRFSKVVGYVMGDNFNVWLNRKFFISPLKIASNLNHEGLHNLGFSHYGKKSSSIPYMVGNKLFEETWKEISKQLT